MADSTRRVGNETHPSTARVSVIECATVKAVTIFSTSMSAGRSCFTPVQTNLSPFVPDTRQHGTEQKGDQKQDMIETEPDMPDALNHEFLERFQPRVAPDHEASMGLIGAQHGHALEMGGACGFAQAKDAAVCRVSAGKQPVFDAQRPGRYRAVKFKLQHLVSTVAVRVEGVLDRRAALRRPCAAFAVGADMQLRQQ